MDGFSYSKANKEKAVHWDEETLYDYLLAPKKYIPGDHSSLRDLMACCALHTRLNCRARQVCVSRHQRRAGASLTVAALASPVLSTKVLLLPILYPQFDFAFQVCILPA